MLKRLAVVTTLVGQLAIAAPSLADTNQLKVQGPWTYVKRSDGAAEGVRYMATTASAEDRDIWLLLVCRADERLDAAIMHVQGFAYELSAPLIQVRLQLDDFPTVPVPAAATEGKQITIAPTLARELVPLLAHSDRLLASIPERDGTLHTYSFSLQPNDRALRDIGLRCYHPGT